MQTYSVVTDWILNYTTEEKNTSRISVQQSNI